MSRFWAGAESSGSDSSGDDSSDYSSEEEEKQTGNNRWVDMSDSDDSDDEARVVKSGKERAIDTFNKHISVIRKAMKDRDYYAIQTEFDELTKSMIKAKKTLAEGVPRSLVRILVELEDYVPERLADKAAFKKLSARQGRSLNRMKLSLKKHNKPFLVVMDEYRKNPVDDDDEEDDDAGNDSDAGSSSSNSSSSSSNSDGSKSKKSAKSAGSVSYFRGVPWRAVS
jgi:translation initiation factor 3 subunit C